MKIGTTNTVIIGGGIAGISTAYYLAQNGIDNIVIERDGVGSHASGHAYGGLGALYRKGNDQATHELALMSFKLYQELALQLPSETGINFDYRTRPTITLCFSDNEIKELKASLNSQLNPEGYIVSWLNQSQIASLEPRISPEIHGGLFVEGTADIEPQRMTIALAKGAEKLGAKFHKGNVTGIIKEKSTIRGVIVDSDEISCSNIVIAMGPWSSIASAWVGSQIEVSPLKGQILRLLAKGEPYKFSVTWNGNYAVTKPDGLVWAGTTEEETGFDESITKQAADNIILNLNKMIPSIQNPQIVRQTACLRPISPDRLPIIGPVNNLPGAFIATGGGRNGINLGTGMGQIIADLIAHNPPTIDIQPFSPTRFND